MREILFCLSVGVIGTYSAPTVLTLTAACAFGMICAMAIEWIAKK